MGLAVANQDGCARLGVVLCRARFSADLARRTVRLVALVIYSLNTPVRHNARVRWNIAVGQRDFNARIRANLADFCAVLRVALLASSPPFCHWIGYRHARLRDHLYTNSPYLLATTADNGRGAEPRPTSAARESSSTTRALEALLRPLQRAHPLRGGATPSSKSGRIRVTT